MRVRVLYLKPAVCASLILLLLASASFAAASPAKEKRECNEVAAGHKKQDVELQVKALLCRAERAEESASWHEERARLWEERAERESASGDLMSAGEPLAAFFARSHRTRKEARLREAQSLRQKAQLLSAGLQRR